MASFLVAIFVGLGVGVLSGLLGIGGGTMMVPLFRLGFGLSALQATATSLFAIIPTSLAGLVQHIRNGTCVIPLGVVAGVGGALLSPVGVQLANASPGWAIMLATAIVIVYSSSTMLYRALKSEPDNQVLEPAKQGSSAAPQSVQYADAAPVSLSHSQLVTGFVIGLVAGLAAGYVGLGGGFLMVPLFVSVIGLSIKQSSGTSLLAICILAMPGVARHLILGNVAVLAGAALAVGTVPGAIIGASLVKRVPERTLRLFFGVFLILVAVFLVLNEFALHF